MTSFHSDRPGLNARRTGASSTKDAAPDEVLAPVIAGAYARGIAETLDLLGLPGLFLDRSGEVLFASRAAQPLLRGPLSLRTRHLVAEDAEDNQVLAAFIARALGDGKAPEQARLPRAALELRRLPHPQGSALPGQLVQTVLLLADDTNPRHAAMLELVG